MTSAAQPLTASRTPGWRADEYPPAFGTQQIAACLQHVREPVHIVKRPDGGIGVARGGEVTAYSGADCALAGTLPPLYPEWLGDRAFCEVHQVRFPYIAGEMAGCAVSHSTLSACSLMIPPSKR